MVMTALLRNIELLIGLDLMSRDMTGKRRVPKA
jgi:hypothetical protein